MLIRRSRNWISVYEVVQTVFDSISINHINSCYRWIWTYVKHQERKTKFEGKTRKVVSSQTDPRTIGNIPKMRNCWRVGEAIGPSSPKVEAKVNRPTLIFPFLSLNSTSLSLIPKGIEEAISLAPLYIEHDSSWQVTSSFSLKVYSDSCAENYFKHGSICGNISH